MDTAELNAIIGRNVRRRRKLLGKTQKEVGDALGVSYQQIQKYEHGRNDLSCAKVVRLAQILGSSLEDLCAGTEDSEEEREPAPSDFQIPRGLGLIPRAAPPPAVLPDAAVMEKSLYISITGRLPEPPSRTEE